MADATAAAFLFGNAASVSFGQRSIANELAGDYFFATRGENSAWLMRQLRRSFSGTPHYLSGA